MAAQDGDGTALAERLVDLEVRMAFLEHSLAELDSVVCKATEELGQVRAVVKAIQSSAEQVSSEVRLGSLEEEVPPHY